MGKATGSFQLSSWNEDTYDNGPGGKMTLATVSQNFSGDIAGDGSVRWLMVYGDDGTARFVGLQKVDGALADRHGTFVLETAGNFRRTNGPLGGDSRRGIRHRRARRAARVRPIRGRPRSRGDLRDRVPASVRPALI